MPTITETLLEAIEQREETLYRIAKDSGVSYPVLHRFAWGERDIKLATAGKLADYLGLELAPKGTTAKPKGATKKKTPNTRKGK